jgi:hypothetical protein
MTSISSGLENEKMAINRIVTKILAGKNLSSSIILGGQQRDRIWIAAAVAAGLQVSAGSGELRP